MTASAIRTATAPLRVSTRNPRYFTHPSSDGTERAVYLTGSHIWNNLHDGMGPGAEGPDEPEPFDFDRYLRFLAERGHNLIRLWRWEQVRSHAAAGDYHLNMTPQPWSRPGPGLARDGRPRFDLDQLDDAYFDRLRERVSRAGEAGIYVDVMLFDGWALHLSPPPDHIEGHPFHARNNVSGIGATSINDLQVLPLDPRVQAIQAAYIRKVVDTLHDLPNVLWEVANESTGDGSVTEEFASYLGMDEPPVWGDSTDWQYWVIDTVKRHEADRGYEPHPIGMTMQFPVRDQTRVNEPLLRSRAEWISPGYDDEMFTAGRHPMAPGSPPSRWYADPPPADGTKVVITDTDHYAPGQGDALWAWKSFLRGHHPILMDFGLLAGFEPDGSSGAGDGASAFESFEATRFAMGETRRYAERMDLVAMEPRGDLTSTGFALANPGHEYLVLQPEPGGTVSIRLEGGGYGVEWHDVGTRTTRQGNEVSVDATARVDLRPPREISGPAVLYLRDASIDSA